MNEEQRRAQAYVDAHRHFNGGAGLVVPAALAAQLAALGVVDGYTTALMLPTALTSGTRRGTCRTPTDGEPK